MTAYACQNGELARARRARERKRNHAVATRSGQAEFADDFGKSGAVKMGGIGSGREGNRVAVEACLNLDINNLRRQGLLRSGVHARWSWTHDGEEVASLEMLVGFGVLHLEGVDQRYDARKIDHAVSTTYTSCNYGGSRPWFRCPNCSCRAGKLYMPLGGRHFLCRRCYDLAYHSQWEEPWWRARRRASKLWQRLGGDPDDDLIPPRPRGMHRRTYERLIAEAERAEDLAGASVAASMSKRFGRRLE